MRIGSETDSRKKFTNAYGKIPVAILVFCPLFMA